MEKLKTLATALVAEGKPYAVNPHRGRFGMIACGYRYNGSSGPGNNDYAVSYAVIPLVVDGKLYLRSVSGMTVIIR